MFIETLTSEEKEKLQSRGLFVQEIGIGFLFLMIILILLWLPGFVFIIGMVTQSPIFAMYLIGIPIGAQLIFYIIHYWSSNIILYTDRGIIYSGKLYSAIKEVKSIDSIKSNLLYSIFESIHKIVPIPSLKLTIRNLSHSIGKVLMKLWPFCLFIWMGVIMIAQEEKDLAQYLGILFLSVVLLVILIYMAGKIMRYFSPYHQFNTAGINIQKAGEKLKINHLLLTKLFKKAKGESFYINLRNYLRNISLGNQEILKSLKKLELYESIINKGNLFDSEKYINSLQTDIIEPLTSLREFLMKQKEELIESQRELSRVRIGGSEGSGNRDLTSKRSESLIVELDTNIGALETMIQKMNL